MIDLLDKNAIEWLDFMSEKLDLYEVERNEYLAEYNLPPKNVMFYQNVILPFCENTLLMDNIAQSENVSFSNPLSSNRLRVRTFIKRKKSKLVELKAEYPFLLDFENNNYISYPDKFPYFIKSYKKEISFEEAINTKNGFQDSDIEICITSEHSIFSILENFIRNSAKHNKKWLNEPEQKQDETNSDSSIPKIETRRIFRENLEIILYVHELEDSEDYYTIDIFDNVSIVSQKQLDDFLNALETDLIDDNGELVHKNLGIADMKINAHLLRTTEEIKKNILSKSIEIIFCDCDLNTLIPNFEVYNHDTKIQLTDPEGEYRFGYRFKLSKPKKVFWIGKVVDETTHKELNDKGIILFTDLSDFHQKTKNSSLAAPQFAILEYDTIKSLNNNLDSNFEFDDLLIKLPYRVILNLHFKELKIANPTIKQLIDLDRIQVLHGSKNRIEIGDLKKGFDYKLLKNCWTNWLNRWIKSFKKVHLFIYLENVEQAKKWRQSIKHVQFGFKVNFISKDNYMFLEGSYANGEYFNILPKSFNIIFDHHGEGFENCISDESKNNFEFIKNGSYFQFDKGSSDFSLLFYPSKIQTQNILTIFQAVEAGLINIYIADERIAEVLGFQNKDIERITKTNKFCTEVNQTKGFNRDLLNNGKTFIYSKIFSTLLNTEFKNIELTFEKNLLSTSKPEYLPNNLDPKALIIHRTFLKDLLKILSSNGKTEKENMNMLYNQFKRVIVVSGGGYPHSFDEKMKVKFQPFSTLNKSFTKYQSKINLLNIL